MNSQRAAVMFGFMLAAAVSRAEIYQWEDRSGGIHFSDSIQKVPPEYRRKVIRRDVEPVPSYTPPPDLPGSGMQPSGNQSSPAAATSPEGGDRAELERRLASLEEERLKAAEEVRIAHRRYVTSLGSRDPSKPQALNSVTFRRREYQEARARLEGIERQIEELRKNLSPP